MKNYLEMKIADEDDEIKDEFRKMMIDKNLNDENSTIDKNLTEQIIDLINGKQLTDKQLSKELKKQLDKLRFDKKIKESNESAKEETDLSIEELAQDKFSDSAKFNAKRSSMKTKKSEPIKSKELNAVKKVKMFYRSCMNETTINDEPTSVNVLLNLIYEYGGEWSLLSKNSYLNQTFKQVRSIQSPTYLFDTIESNQNKLETRIFSVFLHQIQPIFHFYVAPEEFKRNSKDYAIHVS